MPRIVTGNMQHEMKDVKDLPASLLKVGEERGRGNGEEGGERRIIKMKTILLNISEKEL